jgi:transposase
MAAWSSSSSAAPDWTSTRRRGLLGTAGCWRPPPAQRARPQPDVADAAWICQLVEHGLVRPGFVPPRRSASCATSPATPRPSSRNAPARPSGRSRLLEDAGTQAVVDGRRHPGRLAAGRCCRPGRRRARPQLLTEPAKAARAPSSPTPRGPGRPLHPHHGCWWRDAHPASTPADATIQRPSVEIGRLTTPTPRSWRCRRPSPGSTGAPPRRAWPRLAGTCASPWAAHLASWAGCARTGESAGKHHSGRTRKAPNGRGPPGRGRPRRRTMASIAARCARVW